MHAAYIYDDVRRRVSQFTGKERDSETGLDYFGARYYGSNMGRWLSPDWNSIPVPVPYADIRDPQTLNLYGYVRNNPLSHADADGHCDWCIAVLSSFIARHPEVAEAAAKIPQSLGLKVFAGVGAQTPKNTPIVSGSAKVTGYVKISPEGAGAGVEADAEGKIGAGGMQAQLNIPVVDKSKFTLPIPSADSGPTVGGEKVGTSVSTDGEGEVGLQGGEGVVYGVSVSGAFKEFGNALSEAIIGDVVSTWKSVKGFHVEPANSVPNSDACTGKDCAPNE